jgi:hypothetical protein
LNPVVAGVPTFVPSASMPSFVAAADTAAPPGNVRPTSDGTGPCSIRDTVPASWLRADGRQPPAASRRSR